MTTDQYAILGFTVALTVLWGYAAYLWLRYRAVARRQRRRTT